MNSSFIRAKLDPRTFMREGDSRIGLTLKRIKRYLESSEFETKLDELAKARFKTARTGGQRERIHRKLRMLMYHYGQEVLAASLAGHGIGRFFGPTAEAQFAMVAGGIQITLILGEVVYVFVFKAIQPAQSGTMR